MKRFLAGLLIGLVLATAGIALAENPIRLIINGQEIHPDVPPQLINGRVMVPARFVAEPLGAKVEWDGNTKTIKIISQNNITSTYKVTRVVDGDTIKIDYNGKEETVRMIGVNTHDWRQYT
jgi:endonuclease YncB( thermonuclease family)